MKCVVILGPGGSGKSALAARLGEITGLRVIELARPSGDQACSQRRVTSEVDVQRKLVEEDEWIMDWP